MEGNSSETYLTHMSIKSIKIPEIFNLKVSSFNTIKNLTLNGNLTLISENMKEPVEKSLKSFDISDLSFEWGKLNPELSGKIYISSNNKLSGELFLKLIDWKHFLKILEETLLIKKSKIDILRGGFNMLARQTELNKKLIIPVSIRSNNIYVGPINFGDIRHLLFLKQEILQ